MLLILTNKKSGSVSKERVTQEIKKGLAEQKIKSEIRRINDAEFFLEKNCVRVLLKNKPLEKYNMIYFRKASGLPNASFIISEMARRTGIHFIDRFRAHTNIRGKLIQMFLFALNSMPIPKTYYTPEYTDGKIRSAVAFLKTPTIA